MTDVLFSSESVTSGHPDKLCDAISDAIVDACLAIDSNARVAVETCVKGKQDMGLIVLAGEVSLVGEAPDYEAVARSAAAMIGYTSHAIGMDATNPEVCEVQVHITTQSPNIAQGVNKDGLDQGAGDQGMMFGYACEETEAYDDLKGRYFPLAAALSQRLSRRLSTVREQGVLPWSRPDGKSQVTVQYDANGEISKVHTVVIAIQHDNNLKSQFNDSEEAELAYVREQIKTHVVEHSIPAELLADGYKLVVNGTGRFADPGGPYADAGLTGRKIIVDTYGGMGRHGGGAFSGKDPSKVDRSAAYASRWAAKHVVAAGLASRCEIQLAYVIGVAEPVSVRVETFGTSQLSEQEVAMRVRSVFDFRPGAIARDLNLQQPIYSITAAGGHFGRTPSGAGDFPWEVIDQDRIELLQTSQ
ncbi:MAG: methionine adenosyltransferase [Euryarchaeota archaeon]|jgi:S-adenosylmethionine synthetase|nr:methionine adenosyltransferase [Euryarchaeota archaeon]|tara:strand:- start:4247 stop:5491 length:1245 start_codon:yes stop_codon:yes gene_type:complete